MPELRGQMLIGTKIVKTDMEAEQAINFLEFMKGLQTQIRFFIDRHGVGVTHNQSVWYIPDNQNTQPEPLGKDKFVVCKTIEEAGFLWLAQWNQTHPEQKIAVPDSLLDTAKKFMPTAKTTRGLVGLTKLFSKRPKLPALSTTATSAAAPSTPETPRAPAKRQRAQG